jgi:hypothetical protein
MTEQLKQLANEAKRFDGGDWYLAKHLVTDWKMDKQDAAYIAAASPDVVLELIAERDDANQQLRKEQLTVQGLIAERDDLRAELSRIYKQSAQDMDDASDAMEFAAKERDQDKALMREALDALTKRYSMSMYASVQALSEDKQKTEDSAVNKLRARLGGV